MTPALVDYLVQFKDTQITVASNLLKEAEGVASRHPQFIKAALVDIFNVIDTHCDLKSLYRRNNLMKW